MDKGHLRSITLRGDRGRHVCLLRGCRTCNVHMAFLRREGPWFSVVLEEANDATFFLLFQKEPYSRVRPPVFTLCSLPLGSILTSAFKEQCHPDCAARGYQVQRTLGWRQNLVLGLQVKSFPQASLFSFIPVCPPFPEPGASHSSPIPCPCPMVNGPFFLLMSVVAPREKTD